MAKFGRVLLKNADALVICLALAGWQELTKTQLNVATALTLVGLWFVLRLLWRIGEGVAGTPALSATPEQGESQRVFVDNPGAALAIAGYSGFEYIRRSTHFVGKWVTLFGSFEGIAESLERDSVHLSVLLNGGQRVNLRFAMDKRRQLGELQAGQRLTVIGQVPLFGSSFMPESCELVHIEPPGCVARTGLARVS